MEHTPKLRAGLLALASLLLAAALAGPARGSERGESSGLEELVSLMAGSFSSAKQAAADTSYFDIRLRMRPIWTDRSDGFWLYVEQAMAGHEDRPYRQRVYHITQLNEEYYESAVYTMRDPLRFAGAWREAAPFAGHALTPDSLQQKDGCSIILRRRSDGSFAGSTLGRECPSELRGATFATSEVVITSSRLLSWDRGFDPLGRQVWGAEAGGYAFDRLEDWSNRHPALERSRTVAR